MGGGVDRAVCAVRSPPGLCDRGGERKVREHITAHSAEP